MKTHGTVRILVLALAIVVASFSLVSGQAMILLDHVDGFNAGGGIDPGATLTFHMRVIGDATNHLMLNNGFVFKGTNITWGSVAGQFNPAYPWETWFDFVRVINTWSTGSGEDTVGIGLLSLFGSGLPAAFDGIAYSFTIGPVASPGAPALTLDSSWYPPSNPWMWDIIGENVGWGGPYTWYSTPPPFVYTYCEPQPTVLKDIESVLYVHIVGEDPADVDFNSIVVQSKIPPYEPVFVENGEIVTSCFIMRFLGSSGFRPVTADFEATYTVEYDKTDGSHTVLTGDFSLQVYPGDVTFDGKCDMSDVIFMVDYFWHGGKTCYFGEYEVSELMDIDGNGEINLLDLKPLMNLAGLR